MTNPVGRIPFSQWQRGLVLRLLEPIDSVREGWFVFLRRSSSTFTVCRLGEDDYGQICETDELDDVHIDFADSFRPTMRISGSID